MALKFMKNQPASPPTRSSPERTPFPFMQPTSPPLFAANYEAESSAGPSTRRVRKRRREASEEDSSADESQSFGQNMPLAGLQSSWRKRKRFRAEDVNLSRNATERRKKKEREDTSDEETIPSPVKSTGLNLRSLSITHPKPEPPSEYTGTNNFLRMLHLNRAGALRSIATPEPSSGSSPSLSSSSARQSSASPQKPKLKPKPATSSISEQEKESVTRAYEEANRALGRLMLDRRRYVPPTRDSEGEDESDYESE